MNTLRDSQTFCVSCFSVTPARATYGSVHLSLWFQGESSTIEHKSRWLGPEARRSLQSCARSGESKEKVSHSLSKAPANATAPKGPITSPNSTTHWGPSTQLPEPMNDSSPDNHTLPKVCLLYRFYWQFYRNRTEDRQYVLVCRTTQKSI